MYVQNTMVTGNGYPQVIETRAKALPVPALLLIPYGLSFSTGVNAPNL